MSEAFDPNHEAVLLKGEVSGPLGNVEVALVLDTGATTRLVRPEFW
jgi:hypothetical protein